jgi:hypothetical protein
VRKGVRNSIALKQVRSLGSATLKQVGDPATHFTARSEALKFNLVIPAGEPRQHYDRWAHLNERVIEVAGSQWRSGIHGLVQHGAVKTSAEASLRPRELCGCGKVRVDYWPCEDHCCPGNCSTTCTPPPHDAVRYAAEAGRIQ